MSNAILRPNGTMQLRGGTAAAMASENPLLARREVAAEVDTGKLKVGNGVDRWNTLPYVGGSGGGGVSDHEELEGLLGGTTDEHYHFTDDEHRRLGIVLSSLFPNGDDYLYLPVVIDDPEHPYLLPYTPFQNLPKGTHPEWVQRDFPTGFTAYSGVHKMFYGSYYYFQKGSSSSDSGYMDNSLLVPMLKGTSLSTLLMSSLTGNTETNYIYEPSSGGNYLDWLMAKGAATYGRGIYYTYGAGVICTYNSNTTNNVSNYTVVTSSVLSDCNSLCYSEYLDIMLAVGATGDVVVMSYSSGANKFSGSASTKYSIGISVNPSSAAWSPDQMVFCVTGAEGAATSENGVSWDTFTGNDVPKNMGDLSFREDLGCFFARGLTDKYFYVSGDGETWQKLTNTPIPLETVAAVDYTPATGIYCAVGGTGKKAYFSKDLTKWTSTDITRGEDITAGSVIYMPSTKKYILMPTSGSSYYTFNPSDWITDCADTHNGHPSNNDLGEFNSTISAAIQSGAFTGIYAGDYFYFRNVAYTYLNESNTEASDTFTGIIRVLHLDYPQYCGYAAFPTHCALVAPDSVFYSAKMNDSTTTSNGYAQSTMRTTYLRRAKAIFEACFGAEHIVSYTENLVNAVGSTGAATGVQQCNCDVELMDERMVFGDYKYDKGTHNRRLEPESLIFPHRQLAAFEHNHELVKDVTSWWLRNIISSSNFCSVNGSGVHSYGASSSLGVRPFALIN